MPSIDNPEENLEKTRPQKHAIKSEALRRIFRLDGPNILTTFQRARTLSGMNNLFQDTSTDSLPGLGNWDNSCYQNSIIQAFASLPSLLTFLRHTGHASNVGEPRSTGYALKDTILELNAASNAGKKLWTPAELKSMSSWQQQDAQEYFSKVLDEVEKETSTGVKQKLRSTGLAGIASLGFDPRTSEVGAGDGISNVIKAAPQKESVLLNQLPTELASIIAKNPFEGLLAQRVGCLQCGFVEGLSLIPFNCLTVPLGKHWMYDVRTCLDDYTVLEPIKGVECAKCTLLRNKMQLERLLYQPQDQASTDVIATAPRLLGALRSSIEERLEAVGIALDEDDFAENTLLKKCQIPANSRVSTTKSRQAVVARAPTCLAIHVNRSLFDETTGVQRKNFAEVRFPNTLDLSPWCLGDQPPLDAGEEGAETWNVDPSTSMLVEEQDKIPGEKGLLHRKMYQLHAVITHYGRHENGHYICYRKRPQPFSPSNDSVSSAEAAVDTWWCLSDDEVTKVSERMVLGQGGVFMLFYERIQLPAVPEPFTKHTESTSEQPLVSATEAETGLPDHTGTQNHDTIETDGTRTPVIKDPLSATSSMAPLLPFPFSGPASGNPMSPPQTPLPTTTDLAPPALDSPPNHTNSTTSLTFIPLPRPPTIASPLSISSSSTSSLPIPSSPPQPTDPAQEPRKPNPPMRTAGPRNARSRGSVSRAGNAMGGAGAMVEAN
ncbi:hypothetical protein MMC12_000943 [Toensbergia leucococca]|nr:hypothetical protein [Toensbergia leucococca]